LEEWDRGIRRIRGNRGGEWNAGILEDWNNGKS